MYKKEVVGSLLQIAENVVMVEDRFYYAPFLYILEEYCVKNGIVVGGNTGIKMTLEKMLENGLGVGDFYYKLFADDHVYNHAKNIADNMYSKAADVYKLIGMDEKRGGSATGEFDDATGKFDENSNCEDFNLVPLHQITEKQAAELAVYGSDKSIYSFLGSGYAWDLPKIKLLMKNSAEDSAECSKEYFDHVKSPNKQSYFHWAIFSHNQLVGYIGLHPISRELLRDFEGTNEVLNNHIDATHLQIRVFIGKPHQGKGFASKAINLLCKSKNFLVRGNSVIWAVNNAANKPACKSSEKAGLNLVEKNISIPSYNKRAKYNIYVCGLKQQKELSGEFSRELSGEFSRELSGKIEGAGEKTKNNQIEDQAVNEIDKQDPTKDYSAQMLTNQTLSAKLVRFMEMLKYIYVDTNIKDKLVTIYVNMRPIAEIHKIGKYRDIKLIDLIGPILADTLFYSTADKSLAPNSKTNLTSSAKATQPKQNKILCMSYEIQLIELYKFLYNTYPTMEKRSYEETYKTVQTVIEKIKPTFEAKAIGSGEMHGSAEKSIDKSPERSSKNTMDKNPNTLLFQVMKENPTNFVIIGDHAITNMAALNIKLPRIDNPRLQILTNSDQLSTICDKLTNLLQRRGGSSFNELSSFNGLSGFNESDFTTGGDHSKTGAKAIMSKFDLKIPNDKFLEKYTIYIVDADSKRTPIADLYNSLDYDVIPFREDPATKLRYAGIYAILRFKLIDVYASRLIMSIGKTNEDFIKAKISTTVAQIFDLNDAATELIIKDPFLVFQKENHAGRYIAENVLRKRLILDQERLRKYFPYNKKEM